jgi:hypothetical protein
MSAKCHKRHQLSSIQRGLLTALIIFGSLVIKHSRNCGLLLWTVLLNKNIGRTIAAKTPNNASRPQNLIVVRAPNTVAFSRGLLPDALGKSAPGCQMY